MQAAYHAISTMLHSPAMFVLLLMAAAWSSFFLVIEAGLLDPAHATSGGCKGRERDALLAFKKGINDTDGHLDSWQPGRQDCCRWAGITCSNTTGHIIRLDLGFRYSLIGQISPSLLSLEHLEYLNLNYTALAGHNGGVPKFLGSLKNLRHLDLAAMHFTGTVPPQLGNLSRLEYLDLSYSWVYSTDISWLTGLPLLVYLDMRYTNLSSIAADWPLVVNMLPSLEHLSLSNCSLSSANQSLTHFNLTNLQYLDLSYNYLSHPIASGWFWNATNMKYLDLSDTSLYGPFPNGLANMTNLQELNFENYIGSGNKATMTVDLTNLCDLDTLQLGGSLSSGNITKFLEKLPQCPSNMLVTLLLNSNNMVGVLPNKLGHLAGVQHLDLSNNNITGPIPSGIASCTSMMLLYLSNNNLSGHIPSETGMLSKLIDLDLSNNKMDGSMTAELLVSLKNLEHLDLSHNSLSGPLPLEFGAQGLRELSLSFNCFNGHVPESICQLSDLLVLDLSNNFLEGELPQCSQMPKLVFLLLSNNSFSGKFPSTIRNYSSLAFLDLSVNNFYGTLPLWIGEFVYLRFLQLSHNQLHGDIPVTITNLKQLCQLSLAGNNISGIIPWSLSNLTAMAEANISDDELSIWYGNYGGKFTEVLPIVMKRQELKYGAGTFEVVGIDLSLNHLTGGIPDGVTSLHGLLNLNLSWNHLSGNIPANIGAMKSIESLDLSRNNLSAEIPSSLSDLTYLSSLDLSYNNLAGIIPPGSQLDTLYMENPSIYAGNIGLCGPPLDRNCSGGNSPEYVNQNRREKFSEAVLFFYFGLGSGFLVGLWIVFCALLFKKAWRVAYFRLFDKVYDNAYVFVVVTWSRMNGKATS